MHELYWRKLADGELSAVYYGAFAEFERVLIGVIELRRRAPSEAKALTRSSKSFDDKSYYHCVCGPVCMRVSGRPRLAVAHGIVVGFGQQISMARRGRHGRPGHHEPVRAPRFGKPIPPFRAGVRLFLLNRVDATTGFLVVLIQLQVPPSSQVGRARLDFVSAAHGVPFIGCWRPASPRA